VADVSKKQSFSATKSLDKQTPFESNVCDLFTEIDPLSRVWELLFPRIINASTVELDMLSHREDFQQLVCASSSFYTYNRLQKSVSHPPQSEQMTAVMNIINCRLENADTHPALQVAVFSGSSTAGHDCWQNPFIQFIIDQRSPNHACSWSGLYNKSLIKSMGLESSA